MISAAIGITGTLTALIGWFGFHSLTALVIGTVLYIIETLIDLRSLNGGAISMDFVIFGIGCAVGSFIGTPWYVCGMLAVNIYSLIVAVTGFII